MRQLAERRTNVNFTRNHPPPPIQCCPGTKQVFKLGNPTLFGGLGEGVRLVVRAWGKICPEYWKVAKCLNLFVVYCRNSLFVQRQYLLPCMTSRVHTELYLLLSLLNVSLQNNVKYTWQHFLWTQQRDLQPRLWQTLQQTEKS